MLFLSGNSMHLQKLEVRVSFVSRLNSGNKFSTKSLMYPNSCDVHSTKKVSPHFFIWSLPEDRWFLGWPLYFKHPWEGWPHDPEVFQVKPNQGDTFLAKCVIYRNFWQCWNFYKIPLPLEHNVHFLYVSTSFF